MAKSIILLSCLLTAVRIRSGAPFFERSAEARPSLLLLFLFLQPFVPYGCPPLISQIILSVLAPQRY